MAPNGTFFSAFLIETFLKSNACIKLPLPPRPTELTQAAPPAGPARAAGLWPGLGSVAMPRTDVNPDQVRAYREQGFLIIQGFLTADELEHWRATTFQVGRTATRCMAPGRGVCEPAEIHRVDPEYGSTLRLL